MTLPLPLQLTLQLPLLSLLIFAPLGGALRSLAAPRTGRPPSGGADAIDHAGHLQHRTF
jgi:hypothetical protein